VAEREAHALGRRSERAERRRDEVIARYEAHLRRVLAAPPPGAHRPDLDAVRTAWDAERARLGGCDTGALWSDAERAWDAVQWPRLATYAAIRRVDAVAREGGTRGEIEAAVEAAHVRALAIESPLFTGQLGHLAQRLGIAVPGAAAVDAGPAADAGPMGELTRREREVLDLVAAGATNRQIASRLFISEKTASVHVSRILTKLGAANRQEAGAIARRRARA
jgi:DNA-binding CsgD family transcriptional regulator